jgi:hypothetical protein
MIPRWEGRRRRRGGFSMQEGEEKDDGSRSGIKWLGIEAQADDISHSPILPISQYPNIRGEVTRSNCCPRS